MAKSNVSFKAIESFNSIAKAHVSGVFQWSAADRPTDLAEALAAGLGMAVPVLLAALTGHIVLGLLAAAGSLGVGRVEIGLRSQLRNLAGTLAPAIGAALLAVAFAGSAWLAPVLIVTVSAMAATISGFSRSTAAGATRFVVFLAVVAVLPVPPASPDPWRPVGFFILIAAGALWASLLNLVLGTIQRRIRPMPLAGANEPTASWQQKFSRWKRSLTTLAGWSYPLRLVSGLSLAAAMDMLWPGHHLHWVSLTVAILTQRQVELVPVKTTQRALGTALGVGIAGILLQMGLPSWALILLIGLLAGLRPALRNRNYLAYSTVMTPLVVLIIDAGRPLENGILMDRLLATLIGALLTVGANLLFARLTPARAIADSR